jgi:hypothetical protein
MKIAISTFLLLLIFKVYCYSQCSIDAKYYDSLKTVLVQDTNVYNIQLREKRYLNGNIRESYYSVCFLNDSLAKNWVVGKVEVFHKNGQLKESLNFNSESKLIDSTYYVFRKDGNIIYKGVFNSNSIVYCLLIEDDVFYYYPDFVTRKWYKKTGEIKTSTDMQYDYKAKKYRKHGISYSYYRFSDSKFFMKEEKYNMGKKIYKKEYENGVLIK